MIDDLAHQFVRWQEGKIGEAAYAASYFLLWQMDRHGARFASRQQRCSHRPDERLWREQLLPAHGKALDELLIGWLSDARFYKIIPSVPIALRNWILGHWPLTLLTHIPTPQEVLAMQIQGTRPVTVISEFPRALHPVLGKADGFEFLVHDLEHAWKFFHDTPEHYGQRHFFRLLQRALGAGHFTSYLHDAVFAEKFDYLISDMNTHPVHGLRYFHAVLVECLLRREGKGLREPLSMGAKQEIIQLILQLASSWSLEERETIALLALAGEDFNAATASILEQYFFNQEIPPGHLASSWNSVTPHLSVHPIRPEHARPMPISGEA